MQEHYVATFDRNPSHALHLFEHVHGESRDRGQAMVDLIEEYRKYGVEPAANELPDYVPLFLEVLGHMDATGHGEQATALLGDAIHVLAAVGERLARDGTSYAAVFDVLLTRSDVQPQPLTEPPIRDMDEAMEHFGPARTASSRCCARAGGGAARAVPPAQGRGCAPHPSVSLT